MTLVATTGVMVNTEVSGMIELTAAPEQLRESASRPGAAAALMGTASIPVDELGGEQPGDLSSTDPMRPGVLGLERSGPSPRILLRLGSEANRQDMQAFEGSYFVLEVTSLDATGFSGTWRSGVTETVASGYFCAERVP